jgi:serine/threonine protein kinase
LTMAQKLGEGASGVISQAVLRGEGDVAVKLFKGAITSDGLPACELAACVSAGNHPNLIAMLGEILDHPDGVHGCVMALIDPAFVNLAGPPSLASCTRDVYPEGKRFTPEAMLRLARGIAAAAQHLHSRGILHGDLYGHNILHTQGGDALLGDFGAASLFDRDGPHAAALAHLEVRAFGLLLEELMARCDAAPGQLAGLALLQADCVQASVAARPSFDAITRRLN